MKNVKRILASVLITSLALSTSVAYAASEEDYLTMQGAGPERIDSKGDFTFSIHSTVKGNKFEVNGKNATLTVNTADVYDQHYDPYTGSVKYTVSIVTDVLGMSKLTLNADSDFSSSKSTDQLKAGEQYCLRVSGTGLAGEGASGTDPYYLKGSGHVTNVSKVY